MFNIDTTCAQYYEMPSYVEKINTSYVSSNATYIDPDKYYNFIIFNKIYNDRQYIYDLYADPEINISPAVAFIPTTITRESPASQRIRELSCPEASSTGVPAVVV